MATPKHPAIKGLEDTWGSNDRSVQGQFGQSLNVTNPMWARWFDQLHAAAPDAKVGLSAGQTEFQPKGDIADSPEWWLNGLNKGPYAPNVESFPVHIRGLLKGGVSNGPYSPGVGTEGPYGKFNTTTPLKPRG